MICVVIHMYLARVNILRRRRYFVEIRVPSPFIIYEDQYGKLECQAHLTLALLEGLRGSTVNPIHRPTAMRFRPVA